MCRSESGLREHPKALRAASRPWLCRAGGCSPWQQGRGILASGWGDSGRKRSDFQEQSILSLVHREMFATGRCRGLEKG